MRRSRRHRRLTEDAELNVTAFLNLMVVLVPFLLISAVFSQVAILEVNMPEATNTPPPTPKDDEKPKRKVIVTLRERRVQVSDGKTTVLDLPLTEQQTFDRESLINYLRDVKKAQPAKLDSSILLEKQIPYERLIQMMDILKVDVSTQAGQVKRTELFPAVSIGDALPVAAEQSTDKGAS